METIVVTICWCLTFVGLFIYQQLDSARREKGFLQLIEELTHQHEDKGEN